MHLKRVKVPNFRVLKDVDLTFESEFTPRIFPLGSVNGGGKSTLLQLIFILLHCAAYPQRMQFVKNILARDLERHSSNSTNLIASLEISDEQNKVVTLDFLLLDMDKFKLGDPENCNSDLFVNERLYQDKKNLCFFEGLILKLAEIDQKTTDNIETVSDTEFKIESEANLLELTTNISQYFELSKLIQELQIKSQIDKNGLLKWKKEAKAINQKLSQYKIYGLCSVSTNEKDGKNKFLICQYDGIADIHPNDFFESLAKKVFFVAPSTQIFLFLPPSTRKNLFISSNSVVREAYTRSLEQSKINLKNFYFYDFMSANLLVNAFKRTRDLDFAEKIQSGHYGQNYEKLLNEFNAILGNKKVNVEPDLSGLKFFIERDEEQIELYPEDLSHGELKRLNLYLWLKLNNIKDSIVLIDEIEIALHPDWQYQIVRDLEEWEPSNQYILATHSYELCQALTPAHVKELEPRLIKSKSESVQPHY